MNDGRTPSDILRVAHTQKLRDALLLALRCGKWPNRWITIHFGKAELGANDRRFFKAFLKYARDWLGKRGAGQICYVAVFEGHGGQHVHMLMHVPLGFWSDYHIAKLRWIKNGLAELGGVYREGVLRDRAVFYYRGYLSGTASERDYLKRGLRGALLYMLKGATRMDTARFLGLSEDEIEGLPDKLCSSPQGRVCGRRVSVSHNLLSEKVTPPLRFGSCLPWLEEAEREAEAGRDLHRATLKLGVPSQDTPTAVKGVSDGHHRRSRLPAFSP